ncbi:MAG TPA: phosphotransferase, partial [Anaerolineae bacterium]
GAMEIEYAAFLAGYPMPEPITTLSGDYIGIHQQAESAVWVHLYRWAAGTPIAWHTVVPGLANTMGRLLARMHAIPIATPQLSRLDCSPSDSHDWYQLFDEARARKRSWSELLSEKIPALLAWEKFVERYAVDDEPLAPSQRDLHPPNIIADSSGGYLVIDWDSAGFVNAREEVVKFALVWATPEDGAPSPDVVAAFVHGYREAGGTFRSRGLSDLVHREQSRLAWIAYNIRRDASENPGPHEWLTPALLEGTHRPSNDDLNSTVALFKGL